MRLNLIDKSRHADLVISKSQKMNKIFLFGVRGGGEEVCYFICDQAVQNVVNIRGKMWFVLARVMIFENIDIIYCFGN